MLLFAAVSTRRDPNLCQHSAHSCDRYATLLPDLVFIIYFPLCLTGVGVELSLLRTNRQCQTSRVEEVTIVDRNLNYDFNFQQVVHLPEEVVVLPVCMWYVSVFDYDWLLQITGWYPESKVHLSNHRNEWSHTSKLWNACIFDSVVKFLCSCICALITHAAHTHTHIHTNTHTHIHTHSRTQGGLATTDEMCLSFPIYYPKIDSSNCLSTPNFDRITDFISQHVP